MQKKPKSIPNNTFKGKKSDQQNIIKLSDPYRKKNNKQRIF